MSGFHKVLRIVRVGQPQGERGCPLVRFLLECCPNVLEIQADGLRRSAEPLVQIAVEHLDAPQHQKHGRQKTETEGGDQNFRADLRALDPGAASDVELDRVPKQNEAEQNGQKECESGKSPIDVSLLRACRTVFPDAERALVEDHRQQHGQQPDANTEFDFVAHLGMIAPL